MELKLLWVDRKTDTFKNELHQRSLSIIFLICLICLKVFVKCSMRFFLGGRGGGGGEGRGCKEGVVSKVVVLINKPIQKSNLESGLFTEPKSFF